MLGGVVGILLVNLFSRYYLLVVSTVIALALNLMLALASIFGYEPFSFASVCAFMFVVGAALTSVAWTYPGELCTPSIEKYVGLVSMAGTAVLTIGPPFVIEAIPNHESYPLFIFFALYLVGASFVNARMLPHDFREEVEI